MSHDELADLPGPVAEFVRAVNAGDLDRLIRTFAANAMVNDQLCEYWDVQAITGWAARDVIGQRLVMTPQRVVAHHEHTVIDASVDGDYEKRGLPEPLIVTFYFSSRGDELTQLVILRNERDEY